MRVFCSFLSCSVVVFFFTVRDLFKFFQHHIFLRFKVGQTKIKHSILILEKVLRIINKTVYSIVEQLKFVYLMQNVFCKNNKN